MKIAIYVNHVTWSWSLTLASLITRLSHVFTRIQRDLDERLSSILTKEYDFILVQNLDSLLLIDEKEKCVCRIGGFFVDEKNLATRYDEHLKQVASIIATNNKLQKIGERVNNCVMIPNGVDLIKFQPDLERKFPSKMTIGFAGNIQGRGKVYKGWNIISKAVTDLFFEVNFKSCLFDYSQLDHNEMPEFYRSIDILILASIDEGCSNVVTEALACGVPVLLTKVGYHGEMLQDGANCIFIERNVDDIISKIKLLSVDFKLRKKLSINGRKFVETYQDINVIAKEYEKVFEEVSNG